MESMTWEQKVAALKSLNGGDMPTLSMRNPGDWIAWVSGIEVGDGRFLTSVSGIGDTPESAIESLWGQMTNLKPGHVLVHRAFSPNRREIRWNGFMWHDVTGARA
jgi:hypothetical protein